MKYGSEFRDLATLSKLLYLRPLWREIYDSLVIGVNFPMKPMPEEERKKGLKWVMQKGKHKSVLGQDKNLQKSISQGVRVSHLLPIPPEIVEEISEGCVTSE